MSEQDWSQPIESRITLPADGHFIVHHPSLISSNSMSLLRTWIALLLDDLDSAAAIRDRAKEEQNE